MKRLFVLLISALLFFELFAQSEYKYPIFAYGGLKIGTEAEIVNMAKIDSIKVVGGELIYYVGATPYYVGTTSPAFPYTTPEEHGAVINDGISDATAIQSAINTGKKVVFRKGNYLIDQKITLTAQTVLEGAGGMRGFTNGTVIRLMDDSDCTMFNMTGASIGVTIRDITFKGNKDGQNVSDIDIMEFTNPLARILYCTFDSSARHGIYFNSDVYNNNNSIVDGCSFLRCDGAGVYTSGAGQGTHVLNSAFDINLYAFYVGSGETGSFIHNNVESCVYGVYAKGQVEVGEYNYFYNMDSAAIYSELGARVLVGKNNFVSNTYNMQFQENSFGNISLYSEIDADESGYNLSNAISNQRISLVIPGSDSLETYKQGIGMINYRSRIRDLIFVPRKKITANANVYAKLEVRISGGLQAAISFDTASWTAAGRYPIIEDGYWNGAKRGAYTPQRTIELWKQVIDENIVLDSNVIPDSASTFSTKGIGWWDVSRSSLSWDSDSLYMIAAVAEDSGQVSIVMSDVLTEGTKYRIAFKAKSDNIVATFYGNNYWEDWSIITNPAIDTVFQDYEFSGTAYDGLGRIVLTSNGQLGQYVIFDDITVKEITSESGMEFPEMYIYMELTE